MITTLDSVFKLLRREKGNFFITKEGYIRHKNIYVEKYSRDDIKVVDDIKFACPLAVIKKIKNELVSNFNFDNIVGKEIKQAIIAAADNLTTFLPSFKSVRKRLENLCKPKHKTS